MSYTLNREAHRTRVPFSWNFACQFREAEPCARYAFGEHGSIGRRRPESDIIGTKVEEEKEMITHWGTFIIKALQLAIVADQAYAETQTPGASASTLLQPNNFNSLLAEIAAIAQPVPAPAPTANVKAGA